jgi:hypothetical protein
MKTILFAAAAVCALAVAAPAFAADADAATVDEVIVTGRAPRSEALARWRPTR